MRLTASVQPVPVAAQHEPGQSWPPAPEGGGPGVPEVLAPFFQLGKGSVKSSLGVFLKTRVDWLSDQCRRVTACCSSQRVQPAVMGQRWRG